MSKNFLEIKNSTFFASKKNKVLNFNLTINTTYYMELGLKNNSSLFPAGLVVTLI